MISTAEDWHVHSTFSDGTSTVAENVAQAGARGLTTLVLVDHVRRDSPWVADFAEAVPTVAHDGAVVASVPRHRRRVDSGAAIAACTVADPGVSTICALAAAVRGPVNVQPCRDRRGVPRLLEINPRFPGSVAATVAAGVDLPALAMADALGQALPDDPGAYREVAVVRYLEQILVPISELGAVTAAAGQSVAGLT